MADETAVQNAAPELVERLRRNAEFQKRKGWGNNGLLHEAADVIEWMLPALALSGRYGVSSCKLIRHCVLDEPLDDFHRPWDEHDLVGVTRTAENAPPMYAGKVAKALEQWREWLEPERVQRADQMLAERDKAAA